jgi:hypothetical protein
MNERVAIFLRVNEENSPTKERMEERNVDIRFEKAGVREIKGLETTCQ